MNQRRRSCVAYNPTREQEMKFLTSENGAAAAEYALILTMIAVVIVTGLSSVATQINVLLTNAKNAFPAA